MKHCCRFKADDIYYLKDNDFYSSRYLSIGFCPVCQKPVAELVEWRFDGTLKKTSASGVQADELLSNINSEISYSVREINYKRTKYKPYSWRYGINKCVKSGKKEVIKQYACDFYGNKELIKNVNS